MRAILELDVLNDTETQKRVMRWAKFILIPGAAVAGLLIGFDVCPTTGEGWAWLLVKLVAIYLVSLPVHELIHAAFFKLLGPAGTRVMFGYKNFMLYAGCPGVRLSRRRFVAVLIAPLVVLSAAFAALGLACNEPLLAWLLIVLHGSGCTGDLLFVWEILRHPDASVVEDTDRGITLLVASDAE